MRNGKVAVVTGSSRGIGLGILKKYGQQGYATVMTGVSGTPEALEKLRKEGTEVDYVRCNIAVASERQSLLDFTMERHGRVDILVNNAGVAPIVREDILETSEESFDRVLDTNLKGTFFMCQLFAGQMIALKKGGLADYEPQIVNIGSLSAYAVSPNRGEYCISKAGVSMVTQLFAGRLAVEGIAVHEVRPGIIRTDMTQKVREKYDRFIFEEGGLPIGRWGEPDDVAEAVFSLTSGAFRYSTGVVLDVDGGFHIRRL